MGMRALAVDAEPVERRGMRRGEIAVRAAAGVGVDQLEADLGGERLGVLVERGARIALLVRRTVELAGDGDADAFGLATSGRGFWRRVLRHRRWSARADRLRHRPLPAITFGRVPPRTTPTLTVTPRFRSFIASSVWMTLASSRMALRPSSGREPACAGTPLMKTSKRPTPLRPVTILPPSRAGSVTSTYLALRPSASISAREVGLPISSSETIELGDAERRTLRRQRRARGRRDRR